MPQSSSPQLARAPRRRRSPEVATADFECLLMEAEGRAREGRRDDALALCWSARRLAKREGLERVGEADLAIGLLLLDLDRMNEGLEALYRAVRYFAQRGQLYLRGCAEALLAEAALRRGETELAERHLSVAGDLLLSAGGPAAVAQAFGEHARRLEASGPSGSAAALRRTAGRFGGAAAV